jgi:LysR family transcriptional regulator, nitrogen assimilation regulatory protein
MPMWSAAISFCNGWTEGRRMKPAAANGVLISEVSGVQLNRLLVLATRIDSLGHAPQAALKEIIEAEFALLSLKGMFSFSSSP